MRLSWRTIVAFVLAVVGIGILIGTIFNEAFNFNWGGVLNPELASYFGTFISGLVGVIFMLVSALLLFENIILLRGNQFENSLFGMINSFHLVANNLEGNTHSLIDAGIGDPSPYTPKVSHSEKSFKGRVFLYEANQALSHDIQVSMITYDAVWKLSSGANQEELAESLKVDVAKTYNEFFERHVSQLGHYFRFLYNILKFIDESKGVSNKKFYVDIIQSQLSSDELALIFYNGIGLHGEKFFKLIEKYHFLENIEPRSIINADWMINFYPKSKRKKFRFLKVREIRKEDLKGFKKNDDGKR